jgi:hypothetical protein
MIVPARFNGPPASGNGGWTCGRVAGALGGGPAEVTLRMPPPLDTPLSVARQAGTVQVYDGAGLVAQARSVDEVAADPVPPVSPAEAAAAARAYPGFSRHPFPTCYACGPLRDDGLRLFPGPLPDGRTAAPFTAPADASAETAWAALDCPGGWAVISDGRPYVLGRMAADVRAPLRPGERYVALGRCDDVAGRKAWVSTSLYDADGRLVGAARAVWIALEIEGVSGIAAG